MNSISNDYSVRASPVTIIPSAAGSTVLDLQPDPSLRTIGRSTASRVNASSARAADAQPQNTQTAIDSALADSTPYDDSGARSQDSGRPRGSLDLYRSTQQSAGNVDAFHHIDLYA